MIKELRKHDKLTTPFTALKKWSISSTANDDVLLTESGDSLLLEYVDYGNGSSFPTLNKSCNISLEQQSADVVSNQEGEKISGLFYPDVDPQNNDGTYKRVIYSQVKTMFYNDYRDPTKMWGLEYIDFEKSQTRKFLSDKIRVFSIPTDVFGDKLKETSIGLSDNTLDNDYRIFDDGFENLFAGNNLFSKVQEVGDFVNEFIPGNHSGCEDYFNSIATCSAPTHLTASITSSVLLVWTDTSTIPQEDGFTVEKSLDGLTYSTYAYTAQNITSSHDTAVSESVTYWYRVYAYNSFGNSGYSNTASITIPTSSLPSAPTLLTVVSGSAILSWTDNSSDEYGFTIERSVNSGSVWNYLTGAAANVITLTDTSVVALGTYWYRMFAYNIIGSSSFSNTASIHFSVSPPAVPTLLTVVSGSANLSWVDNSTNENGFTIERSTNSGSTWAFLQTASANYSASTDTAVTTPGSYSYRIFAHNYYGSSSFSNTASINFTASIPPVAPTSLVVSSGSAILTWNDNSDNEAGFYIDRSTNSGSTWSNVITASANATRSTDSTVTTPNIYAYRVYSFNVHGTSSYSNTASINFTASSAPVTFSYDVATETVAWSEGQVGFPNTGDLAAFRATANLNLVTAISFPGGENINSVIIGDQMPLLNQLQINDPTPITTSVQSLPNTITQLTLWGCGLTDATLPTLPSTLIRLYVTDNPALTTLPTLPTTLQLLAAGLCTNLVSLPTINTTVIDNLDVSSTALTSLPAIPNTMESLTIDNTLINPLPTLTGATNLQILSAQNDTALTAIPTLPVTVQEMYFNGCSNLATIPSLQGLTADYLGVDFSDTALDAVAITNLCNQLDLGGTVGGYLNILGTGVPPGAALVSIGNLEMLGRDWSVDHD